VTPFRVRVRDARELEKIRYHTAVQRSLVAAVIE
jgi:hypothetical protein